MSLINHLIPKDFENRRNDFLHYDRSKFYDEHNPNTYRSWAHEKIINSDTLLITIGESWTWGEDLGINNSKELLINRDNFEYRINHVFGSLLQKKLNSDWYNFAWVGNSNWWIINILKQIINNQDTLNSYKKVYIVLTLTEIGREYIDDPFGHIDREISDFDSIDELLKYIEFFQFNELKDLIIIANSNISITIGKAFTDTHLENKDIIKDNLLNETWCDLINKNSLTNNLYKDSVYAVTGCSLEEIDKRLKEFKIKHKFKENMIKLLDKALERCEFFNFTPILNQNISRHPTEFAHKLWADYLLDVFMGKL